MNDNIAKTKRAAAIEYTPGANAPRVVASGRGHVAERILDEAQKNKVPIHKDEELAGILCSLNIGDEITPEIYTAVAQILVFVSDIDKLMGKKSI